jgi:protocatechuate 3,4-dioxygenase beta subunit
MALFSMKLILSFLVAAIPALTVAQSVREAPPGATARIVLADSTRPGARLAVAGRVLGANGRPIPGASIYAYQTDATGRYIPGGVGAQGSDTPQIFGFMRSDASGNYAFTTIKPGSYPDSRNPAHIHFEVSAPGHANRIYEIVFEGDPFISDNFRAQAREPFGGVEIVSARTVNGVIQVAHDIRLKGR